MTRSRCGERHSRGSPSLTSLKVADETPIKRSDRELSYSIANVLKQATHREDLNMRLNSLGATGKRLAKLDHLLIEVNAVPGRLAALTLEDFRSFWTEFSSDAKWNDYLITRSGLFDMTYLNLSLPVHYCFPRDVAAAQAFTEDHHGARSFLA